MPRPNTKTERLHIRLTTKEKSKLEAQATKRGQTLTDFVRSKTLKDIKDIKNFFDQQPTCREAFPKN